MTCHGAHVVKTATAVLVLASCADGLVSVRAAAPPVSPQARASSSREVVNRQVEAFSLQDVRLLDGPFREAMLRDQEYLLALDQDRLLHNFRVTAGIPSAATPLGGWEAPDVELRGHSIGHYLTALALMYYHPTETFDITYAVPATLLANKTRITVKFEAAPGASTGGVLDVRTARMPAR